MTKGSIWEDIKIVNRYVPNIWYPHYIGQLLTTLKGEIDSNAIIAGDINTPVTAKKRSSRQKINKET